MNRARRLHDRLARLVARRRFWTVAIGLLFGMPLCSGLSRRAPAAVPVLGPLPAFTLESSDDPPLDTAFLAGRAWVGAFIDPACEPCCSRAAAALRRLQQRTRNLGAEFAILAIAIDPRTTREWLRARASIAHANPRAWWFTRGLDAPRLLEAVAALVPAARAPGLANGTEIILVDSRRRLRGAYASDGESDDVLLGDLTLILNRDR